jgi:hypothetical protein
MIPVDVPDKWEFTMGEAFPATDPVARWLVTVSLALRDLIWANTKMDEAADEAADDRTQYFRMTCLHLWEIAKFLQETHDAWPEVEAFVDGLPAEARQHLADLRAAVNTEAELGGVGVEAVQIRDFLAHYGQARHPLRPSQERSRHAVERRTLHPRIESSQPRSSLQRT